MQVGSDRSRSLEGDWHCPTTLGVFTYRRSPGGTLAMRRGRQANCDEAFSATADMTDAVTKSATKVRLAILIAGSYRVQINPIINITTRADPFAPRFSRLICQRRRPDELRRASRCTSPPRRLASHHPAAAAGTRRRGDSNRPLFAAVHEVRFWHKADIPMGSTNVRFWG